MLRYFAVLLALLTVASVTAQTPILEEPGYKPSLVFDVATVRQSPPPGPGFKVTVDSPRDSGRFDATNLPARTLLQIAYGYDAPLVNEPEWLGNTFFDIRARADEAEDARLSSLPANEVRLEKRHAIRLLLADRFGLKTHMETRNSAIYNLTVAKGGLKMTAVPSPKPAEDGAPTRPVVGDVQAHPSQHGLEFVGTNSPMIAITSVLSGMIEAPVADKTGLAGGYNYTLQIARPWSARDPESFPDILSAVPEQMGLKLVSVHEAVPNLVIDAMKKPTEN